MARLPLVAALAVAVTAAGCAEQGRTPVQPDPIVVPIFESARHAPANVPHNFRTHMSGREEVPAADTRAQGQAIFQLSKDGTEIAYKLIVANIENVFMAHIHQAPRGANGDITVWLYPSTTPGPGQIGAGRFNGVLAEGVITADNFVGPLAGQPLSALLDDIRSGNAYVNVHTSDGSPDPGPGNFPPGEVRGQIR